MRCSSGRESWNMKRRAMASIIARDKGRTFKVRWVTWGQIRLVLYRSHFMFPDPVRVSGGGRAGGVAVALTVTTALGSTVIKGSRLTVDCIPTSVSIADSNCPR